MKTISALTAFALAIPTGELSAGKSALFQSGRYEVAVALELPHLVDAAARKTATICIDPDNTAPYGLKALSDNNPLAKCSPKSSRLVDLRSAIYPRLASVANRWARLSGSHERYDNDHAGFLERCHEAGQRRPTPLLPDYGPGDFNRLHQDIYGDLVFPLQVPVSLSRPGEDFTGGEFVLTEQRPRLQSKASVVPLRRGDAVVFPVRDHPAPGARGYSRVTMRHGVSDVRAGRRRTLGLIFHDAR